ncbi:MAG: T9SS type A sorting domain-containing protein [Bacteroidetes bacterium]|nr:T9SS type A sorting domain-containing protein [Bacteroidota bacterium]
MKKALLILFLTAIAPKLFSQKFVVGSTKGGGIHNTGSFFRLNMETDEHEEFFSFSALGPFDPIAYPLQGSDGRLYGETRQGGDLNVGTVFSLKKDGSDLKVLHSFNGQDGQNPSNGLCEASNGKLYGIIGSSTNYGKSVIYVIDKDGENFEVLHELSQLECKAPSGGLIEHLDGYLYGLGLYGGTLDKGVIYRIKKDGTGFQVVYEFAGGLNGERPVGQLVSMPNGNLYGVTNSGGSDGGGIFFRFSTTNFNLDMLHDFVDDNKGISPIGGLTKVSNGYLYGHTAAGGTYNLGTIYRIDINGNNFNAILDFNWTDVLLPKGRMVEAQGKLWGITSNFVIQGNEGSIYSIDKDGSNLEQVHYFSSYYDTESTTALAVGDDGNVYGFTAYAGSGKRGGVFSINTDNLAFTEIKNFTTSIGNGFYPSEMIEGENGMFYGSCSEGGNYDKGVIYSYRKSDGAFSVLHHFDDIEGAQPLVLLFGPDGKLYGNTLHGGDFDEGTIYRMEMDGSNFQLLHSFDSIQGALPISMLIGSDNNLYGITINGGVDNGGIVYRIPMDGSSFTVLKSFLTSEGFFPSDILEGSDGYLYTTLSGGVLGANGSMYRMMKDGSMFQAVHSFVASLEGKSIGGMIDGDNGYIYGLGGQGGLTNGGVLFKIGKDSFDFSVAYNFAEIEDGFSPIVLSKDSSNVLWGLTSAGGTELNGLGTLFSCNLDGSNYINHYNFEGLKSFFIEGKSGLLFTDFPTSSVSDSYIEKNIISISPNPNNGNFKFFQGDSALDNKNFKFSMTSSSGNSSHFLIGNLNEVNSYIAEIAPLLNSGVYFISLTEGSFTYTNKVIVIK